MRKALDKCQPLVHILGYSWVTATLAQTGPVTRGSGAGPRASSNLRDGGMGSKVRIYFQTPVMRYGGQKGIYRGTWQTGWWSTETRA